MAWVTLFVWWIFEDQQPTMKCLRISSLSSQPDYSVTEGANRACTIELSTDEKNFDRLKFFWKGRIYAAVKGELHKRNALLPRSGHTTDVIWLNRRCI